MTLSDAELVRRALSNPDDYLYIVERFEKPLLRFVRTLSRLSREDAEDLTQQVFIKAYEHLADVDQDLKLSTWLFRIARNEVIDHWRRTKVRPQESELTDNDHDSRYAVNDALADELDADITAEDVQKVLALLKPDYREVLVLYFFEEKTYEEIADIIRRPPGTVAALISRAKKAFSELAARTGKIAYLTSNL